MIISIIVATANNRVIGKGNKMPWHLPEDLSYFKKITLGNPVFMGRKTFESIGFALPGRLNIVLSNQENYIAKGAVVVNSFEKALSLANKDGAKELFIIGGGKIYETFISKADRLYLTKIDLNADGDTTFPNWEEFGKWELISETPTLVSKTNLKYNFLVYERLES